MEQNILTLLVGQDKKGNTYKAFRTVWVTE